MLRLAILGGGHGARVHLPAARAAAGVEPVVIAARSDPGACGVERMADWRAAVVRDDVDAVVVALPPAVQREAVVAAAQAGKAVLCEKPAGLNAAETKAMIAACEGAGVVHAVGFQFRFEPALAAFRAALARGAVGRVEAFEIDWLTAAPEARSRRWSWRNDAALGGGATLNFASHALDYLRWIAGAEPRVLGRAETVLAPAREADDGTRRPVTAPDRCDLIVRLGDGPVASLRVSNLAAPALGHRIVARGEQGALTLWFRPPFGPEDTTLILQESDGASHALGFEKGAAGRKDDSRVRATVGLLSAFAKAARGGEVQDLPTLADALAVQEALAQRASAA